MATMPPMQSFPELLKLIWQRLGSMSLAIILLMILAIASVIGTVLLQNQSQMDYLQQFGPLWYWVFRSLGLFDMYHTWWFITLLGFLMVSLSSCLWRNVPKMTKEMRTRKGTINQRSLARMEMQQKWTLDSDTSIESLQEKFRGRLYGWEFKQKEENGVHYVRADKGRWHKWGYISVHTAMLVILIGGWMSVEFGFRGNMAVPEGAKDHTIEFLQGTETATLDMPFEIRCNSFVIDFFPTGAPKEFRSNLTIIDGLDFKDYSTKTAKAAISAIAPDAKSVLFIDIAKPSLQVQKSFDNIIGLDALPECGANVYDILKKDRIIIDKLVEVLA